MPTASLMIRGDAYRSLPFAIQRLYASYTTAFFTQLIFSIQKGALYIDRPMSVYRSISAGSWTESVVNNPDVYIYWSNKYLEAVRSYDELTGYEYKPLFERAIAGKHFAILKHGGISTEFKREYFSRNKSELVWWQISLWLLIRCFPECIPLMQRGRKKLAGVKARAKALMKNM